MIRAGTSESGGSSVSGPSPEHGRQLVDHSPAGSAAAQPQLDKSGVVKQPRTIPCGACRAIRRSCEWLPDQRACVRCSKLGKAESCSGPSKRSRHELDSYRRGSRSGGQLSIAPSSPTSQMAATQLSYSLTYHLVNTFLAFGPIISLLGVDHKAYAARFRISRGRCSSLSEDDEILSLVLMLGGAQLSGHSAIVGHASSRRIPCFDNFRSTSELFSIQDVGLCRRQAIGSIFNTLRQRLERYSLDDPRHSTAEVADRLALVYMSLTTFASQEDEEERFSALGRAILRGVLLLDRPECEGDLREGVLMCLQGMARHELRCAFTRDAVSAISLDMYDKILGPPVPTPLLQPCTDEELALVFNTDPAKTGDFFAFFERHFLGIESYFDHLAHVLIFTPRRAIPAAVRHCWTTFDSGHAHLRRFATEILEDDRLAGLTLNQRERRPSSLLSNTFTAVWDGMLVLCGCHRALLRKGGEDDILQESEKRLQQALSDVSEGVQIELDLPIAPIGLYLTMVQLSYTLGHFHGPILDRWVVDNPRECEQLLQGLRYAAFGLPDAARQVQKMERLLERSAGTETTAERIVEEVVTELGAGVDRLSVE